MCLITLTDSPEEQKNKRFTKRHRNGTIKTQLKCFLGDLTSEDGLVNTQGGGLDGNDPDVGGNFVTNCWDYREYLIFTELLHKP